MLGGGPAWEALDRAGDYVGEGELEPAVREVRNVLFFDFFPSLGLLLLAPLAMLFGRRRARQRPEDWSFALTSLAVVLVGCLAWGLLAFGDLPSRTVLHVSSYMLPILAYAACVAGLRAVAPRFAIVWTLLGAALMLAIYVPVLDPLPETSWSFWNGLLAALALAGFGAMALSASGRPADAAGFPPDRGRDRRRAADHDQQGDDVVEDQRAAAQVQPVGRDDRADRHR